MSHHEEEKLREEEVKEVHEDTGESECAELAVEDLEKVAGGIVNYNGPACLGDSINPPGDFDNDGY